MRWEKIMTGSVQHKRTPVQLLLMPFLLLYGCTNSPSDISMAMSGTASILQSDKSAIVAPRKLKFTFEYRQIELTRGQRNRLLYLYDWQHGVSISYGKAKAENDYSSLSIGHQRVQAITQALTKHIGVIQINYDPTLAVDSMLIEEQLMQTTGLTTAKPAGLLESTRL